jgi:hypothetical protein
LSKLDTDENVSLHREQTDLAIVVIFTKDGYRYTYLTPRRVRRFANLPGDDFPAQFRIASLHFRVVFPCEPGAHKRRILRPVAS